MYNPITVLYRNKNKHQMFICNRKQLTIKHFCGTRYCFYNPCENNPAKDYTWDAIQVP